MTKSKASLSMGRKSWCVIFRHPIRKDDRGKPVRVRRGLGTENEEEAQRLVDEMNEILAEEAYHNPEARLRAAEEFDPKIVAAFYDNLTPTTPDFLAEREKHLPLPPVGSTAPRVLLLGPVGAGKTTVVRQLLGTDPESERFPSTATARTTLCPMEFILGEPGFRAVITFMPEEHVRLLIEECLQDAARQALRGSSAENIAKSMLEHHDNVFRLSYVLGGVDLLSAQGDTDDWSDDLDFYDDEPEEAPASVDRDALRSTLEGFIDRLREVASKQAEETEAENNLGPNLLDKRKRQEFEEAFEFDLAENEVFSKLVDDLLDQVRARFDLVNDGSFITQGGWPQSWVWECHDRKDFLDQIRQFSSNNAAAFGRLLTPLVNGVRVAGEFQPGGWANGNMPEKLVILDGMGLGHTSEGTHSLSTSITKLFDVADVILLIDNAQQPMGHWPRTIFNTLVASGHDYKVALGLTHFDLVEGDNMPTSRDKVRHLQLAIKTAIRAVGSRTLEAELQGYLKDRVVYLEFAHQKVTDPASLAGKQLKKLLKVISDVSHQTLEGEAQPVYDDKRLQAHISQALQAFHDIWLARLGIEPHSDTNKEHWTRVKALTRRLGLLGVDEYDNLRPVADLAEYLLEELRGFLDAPIGWRPADPPEEERALAKRRVAIELAKRIRSMSNRRVLASKLLDWQKAYHHRGSGSATKRAYDLRLIYDLAAPPAKGSLLDQHEAFVGEVYGIVAEAIQAGGGYCRGGLARDD